MKIVVPMAGRGSRFEGSGHARPKPLIEVLGIPMVIHALKSLEGVSFSSIIFVALMDHEEQFGLSNILKQYVKEKYNLVLIPEVTKGQLCTVLEAKEHILGKEDFLVISSDTIVKSGIGKDILEKPKDCKGIISVADMEGSQWSFAKTDGSGRVTEVAEKVRISPHASTGLYYFSEGDEFVARAEEMVKLKKTTRGEYYVIPLYQEYINDGAYIGISKADEMWDMGTPDALGHFLSHIK